MNTHPNVFIKDSSAHAQSNTAMKWAVGLAVATTVAAVAAPVLGMIGGAAGLILPYILIAKANMSMVGTVAATYVAAQLWTAGPALIAGAAGALLGAVGGGSLAISSARDAMSDVDAEPPKMEGFANKLAYWRERTKEGIVNAPGNAIGAVGDVMGM
jgi:hypothetical protein